jgi:hypothetical protein
MAKRTQTVKLETPIAWFEKFISEITLREPTCAEFLDLGVPSIWGRTPDGMEFTGEKDNVIRAYLDRCMVNVENGSAIFPLLSIGDGIRLKSALLSFFSLPAAPETSNTDLANSPST